MIHKKQKLLNMQLIIEHRCVTCFFSQRAVNIICNSLSLRVVKARSCDIFKTEIGNHLKDRRITGYRELAQKRS